MALDLMTHVRDESARFAHTLRDVDPATRVPSCPGWSAADLLHHVAEVHWFWASVVGGRISEGHEIAGAQTQLHELRALCSIPNSQSQDPIRLPAHDQCNRASVTASNRQ